jgi:hypothetical protein
MTTKSLFLFFCLFSLAQIAKSQKAIAPYLFIEKLNLVANKPQYLSSDILKINAQKSTSKISTLPPNFYYNCLGFFCKQEIKIAKLTNFKFPIAFRLGSLQYVNYLEGKPNTKFFNQ